MRICSYYFLSHCRQRRSVYSQIIAKTLLDPLFELLHPWLGAFLRSKTVCRHYELESRVKRPFIIRTELAELESNDTGFRLTNSRVPKDAVAVAENGKSKFLQYAVEEYISEFSGVDRNALDRTCFPECRGTIVWIEVHVISGALSQTQQHVDSIIILRKFSDKNSRMFRRSQQGR